MIWATKGTNHCKLLIRTVFKVLGFLFHIQWGPAEVNELNVHLNHPIDVNPDTCITGQCHTSNNIMTEFNKPQYINYPMNETQNNFAKKLHLHVHIS